MRATRGREERGRGEGRRGGEGTGRNGRGKEKGRDVYKLERHEISIDGVLLKIKLGTTSVEGVQRPQTQ